MPKHLRLVRPFERSLACVSAMDEAGGESVKGLLASAWKTALSG